MTVSKGYVFVSTYSVPSQVGPVILLYWYIGTGIYIMEVWL